MAGPSFAQSPLNATGFGFNINEALLNPFEAGTTDDDLRRQIAGILHTVRMSGGTTVRWFVTDVWPQYRCSRDPEDQATRALDPAWFVISRLLLQQAQREGISVVVVMSDTTNDTFAGLPRADDRRDAVIAGWNSYRQAQQGRDRYTGSATPCAQSFQAGYAGHLQPEELFEDPVLIPLFTERFLRMAQFLKQFPALGALEMFNEPDFGETERPAFALTVTAIRNALYARDRSLTRVPLYSGIAFWNDRIARNLIVSGDFAAEPYINFHYYRKSVTRPHAVPAEIANNMAYLRRVAPGKDIVIAEAGANDPVYDLREHAELLRGMLKGKVETPVGMWMWGTFAADTGPHPDLKWEYTVTALSGGSFRDILIDHEHEDAYRAARPALFTDVARGKRHDEPVAIGRIAGDDPNPLLRLRWTISVGGERFISVSRAGILSRVAPTMRDAVAEPASVVAFDAATDRQQWADITADGGGWRMRIYRCTSGSKAVPTPPYVLDYARKLGRADFAVCGNSSLIASGLL